MPRKTVFKVGLAVMLTDQLLKWWFVTNEKPIKLNSGGAWGFGVNANEIWLLLAILSLVVLWFLFLKNHRFSWWLVLGGAGNLLDRVRWGGVVDYLPFFHWWFNVSDLLIIGGLWGIVYSIFNDR